MILIDYRKGSVELAPLFENYDVEFDVLKLDGGDFMFFGNGAGGGVYPIGVERKKLHDFVSSFEDGRLLAHQIPEMHKLFSRSYIVIEGLYRVSRETRLIETRNGTKWRPLQIGTRTISANQFYGMQATLREFMGVSGVQRTLGADDTVNWIISLFQWWNKPYDQHNSQYKVHTAANDGPVLMLQPSLRHKLAANLPDIGGKLARRVAKHFRTSREMLNAPVEEWVKIEGIGKGKAEKLVRMLKEE